MKTLFFLFVIGTSLGTSCKPSSSRAESFQRSPGEMDTVAVSADSSSAVPELGHNPLADRTSRSSQNVERSNPVNVREKLMQFAESLVGVPYKYASTDPSVGLDCSGFITHVFNHFNITVPRSSIDFTNEGAEVIENEVQRGDIILFTGTNHKERFVGHMGLVVSADEDQLTFIHSTSGKAMSVTITPLNEYYRRRLVGFRRMFN